MINAGFFTDQGDVQFDIRTEQFAEFLQNTQGLLWVDFSGEPPEICEPILRKVFGFHPLAIDDALFETHVPKLDDWDDYLYIALQALTYHQGDGSVDIVELDVFLGSNYMVTYHDLPIPVLEKVWNSTQHNSRHYKHGADHLLYRLTDELASDYMHIVEELDEGIEFIEDQIFTKPTPQMVQRIFTLKRATLHLRRSISPFREVLNKLARDDFSMIDERDQVYFRDVYDHMVRLHDITEGLRDLVGGVIDTYLSVINNRMNEIMKTLTIITTLFMPLSFLVGFFGMNFFIPVHPLDGWVEPLPFYITLAIILITPLIMYAWMRNRRWL
jgi:magnesium transporter